MRVALYTKWQALTAETAIIEGLMKLPTDIHLGGKFSSPSATPDNGGTRAASASQTTSLPRPIQTLIHTWAKVESSQALSPQQNQQVLSQLALLSGAQPNQNPATSGISERLNLSQLAKTITSENPLPPKLTLALIKLTTVNGPLSILSERNLPPNTEVYLTQAPSGKLQIQTPKVTPQLEQFRNQFIARQFTPSPIALIDNRQAFTIQNPTANQVGAFTFGTPLPSSTLQSNSPLTPNIIQQAFQNSGQNLESQLRNTIEKLINAPAKNHASQTQPIIEPNISQKLQKVEQQIQKWVQQFQQNFKASNQAQTQQPVSNSTLQHGNTVQADSTNNKESSMPPKTVLPTIDSLLINKLTQSQSKTGEALNPLLQGVSQDHKVWLLQSQQQLINALKERLLAKGDQMIPNWSNHPSVATSVKTFQDLSQWLTLLMLPKQPQVNELSVWPKNLSVQPQLQQTLMSLLNSLNTEGSAKDEIQLLRQLLNINQSLTKITHDQIQNRIWQGQPDNTQFQLSLPYIHQQQIQWCDLECQQDTKNQSASEKINGWHLILRFAQTTPEAFAIESYLKQSQVTLTLWANETEQLKRLHENIPLIKQKLEKAGFNVDQISSKHGKPKPMHQPIQQSLIDVRT
ncbi:MAG: hypothetical protein HWE18_05335 [Gammaproteobacteria bacterium]|nr:hypothetical protein [Gammaproteobacteria bacterium]